LDEQYSVNLKYFFLKYYLLIISFFIILFSLTSMYLSWKLNSDFTNNSLEIKKCNYFVFTKNITTTSVFYKNLELTIKEIYIFPNIENIFCIGKAGYVDSSNTVLNGYVYTNTKFINFMLFVINLILLFLYFFNKQFTNFNFLILFFIINGGVFFNFYQSLNIVSFNFVCVPLFTYFLKNLENYEN